jgi:histidine triad (HIT) family protein
MGFKTMDSCVLCKICSHSLSAQIVYEDDSVIAVMDINPIAPGHVVVIPKAHTSDYSETSDHDIACIAKIVQKIGRAQKIHLGASGFNILSANGKSAQQSVFHTHFHVVPRYENDGLDLWFHGKSTLSRTQHEAFKLLVETGGF